MKKINKIDMFDFITESYCNYGNEVNKNRMITLSIDGLKPIERRVLLSAFKIAKNKKVKSVQIDGHCLGHYHPHSMCYGTIVQMVKQGFLDGQGQFGANIGTEPTGPAASRYTECGLNSFTKNMAFELIDYVPWIEGEISAEIKEPLFLPTRIPFCLMGKTPTGGIGFGYASNVPCYKIEDLTQRLMWLLKERKKEPIIAPITDCEIKSTKKDLQLLLTTGKATLVYKAIYKINKIKKQIIIKSLPPKVTFQGLYSRLQKKYKDLSILDSSCDDTGTNVILYIDRVRNQQTLFDDLIKDFDVLVSRNVGFENNQIEYDNTDSNHNMKLRLMSVDEMLIKSFEKYKELYNMMLHKKLDIITNKMLYLDILGKIKKILPKYLKKIKIEPDVVIGEIANIIGEEVEIVSKIMNDYPIVKLLKVKIDVDKLKIEAKEIQSIINDLHNHIILLYNKVEV